MRRFVWRGLGLLLGVVVAHPAAAQRGSVRPAFAAEEPRANPVFPAVLVPFTIAPEICRQGHTPRVELRVYNSLTQPVGSLTLRDRPAAVLDSISLKCGNYVASWDAKAAGSMVVRGRRRPDSTSGGVARR